MTMSSGGLLGKTDHAGLSDPSQPRGDVDAVAHEIVVALLDVGRDANVALDMAFRVQGIAQRRPTDRNLTSAASPVP